MDVREVLHKFDEMLAQGRVREAGAFLEESAAECARCGDHAAAVTVFNELEGFWRAAGQQEKCFSAAETALALLSSAGLEGGIDHATTLLNYATAKSAFGFANEALELFQRVEVIYDAQLAEEDYRFASLYNNMAQALMRARSAAEAESYFSKSLALLAHIDDTEAEKATCRTNIAVCMMAQGRFDDAARELDAAEKLFGALPHDPHRASMFAARGQFAFIQKNYAAAADYYAKAAADIEKRFGRNGAVYAAACRNCAKAYDAAGRANEAARFREAASAAVAGSAPTRP